MYSRLPRGRYWVSRHSAASDKVKQLLDHNWIYRSWWGTYCVLKEYRFVSVYSVLSSPRIMMHNLSGADSNDDNPHRQQTIRVGGIFDLDNPSTTQLLRPMTLAVSNCAGTVNIKNNKHGPRKVPTTPTSEDPILPCNMNSSLSISTCESSTTDSYLPASWIKYGMRSSWFRKSEKEFKY